MKNKKVYISPVVKGVHVLLPASYQSAPSLKDYEVKEELNKIDEDKKNAEIKVREDAAYRSGRLDAEKSYEQELKEIKSRSASLAGMFQEAIKHFIEKRDKLLEECEPEIIKLIITIASRIVGYEIDKNSIKVLQNVLKDALSFTKEKKIIAIRLSCDDAKKMKESEGIKIADQDVKFIEDNTISPGGCVIDTNFGSIDSRIETRWEEITKAFSENINDKPEH
ncbi:MAG: hypothetical protein HBSAPP01_14370 [Candidatus Brocadia sapporoensis]|nr:hypothetical protein [Candidatus Brocadia sp.]GJQ23647.1 MAG: hypothetical protein HBSAPP01_14370 [Candidatus Brocadia sapporoensis]